MCVGAVRYSSLYVVNLVRERIFEAACFVFRLATIGPRVTSYPMVSDYAYPKHPCYTCVFEANEATRTRAVAPFDFWIKYCFFTHMFLLLLKRLQQVEQSHGVSQRQRQGLTALPSDPGIMIPMFLDLVDGALVAPTAKVRICLYT